METGLSRINGPSKDVEIQPGHVRSGWKWEKRWLHIRYMNIHIRSDGPDPMRKPDKNHIQKVGQNEASHAPHSLWVKVQREGVYVGHRVIFPPSGAIRRDPLSLEKWVEDGSIRDGQVPPDAPPRNWAERRRLEQELKKLPKQRKWWRSWGFWFDSSHGAASGRY